MQVHPRDPGAASVGGSTQVDLSKAGPADSGPCTTGTGGDFGVFGGPTAIPTWLTPIGATEHYRQPAIPIGDPLASVNAPAIPATSCNPDCSSALANGLIGCPAAPTKPCRPRTS